ncbi:bifunctional 2-polyprenyl-6-hydroxyphenol methylase/3-demethylubiquinol 3-O-methyltransferase UbiG [Microbacterium sp. AG238]|uniref:class I SAM-dependent methyltransferase n=1 Tax=Microbacterium sp. AG238 TaxID=2183994 RepID=UPI0011C36A0C|nr:class I SAM-dependent methyltransferase [Microbacterium sp. AG238]
MRFYARKNQADIVREWDSIAPLRDLQVSMHQDASYDKVLEPWILTRAQGADAQSVIDVGCGTGRLTSKLSERSGEVLGIDPSGVSIEIARAHDHVSRFQVATAEQWASRVECTPFDLAVANMVLMDALDLDGIVQALGRLAAGGRVLLTIAHPAFWPIYWDYAHLDGFDYLAETVVEAPFKTSSQSYGLVATHVHRPLQQYLESLDRHGLRVTSLEELRGPERLDQFPYPRFIGIEAAAST